MRLDWVLFLFVLSMAGMNAQGDDTKAPSAARVLPGMLPSGKIQLPTQWSLSPVGKQIALGDFPVHMLLHPKENVAAILHCGYGEHEVVCVDLAKGKVVSRSPVDQAFFGMSFDKEGTRLFVSGGEREVVTIFDYERGYLMNKREIQVVPRATTFVPAGVAYDRHSDRLLVAGVLGHKLASVPPFPESAAKFLEFKADEHPYNVLVSDDGKRAYVSLWGAAAIAVIDLAEWKEIARWKTASHPSEMAFTTDQSRLIVACANSNSVMIFHAETGKAQETLQSALYPNADVGSTPNSIALSNDGRVLAIANADNNNIAIFDISVVGAAKSLGYLPVGWYPTSVRFERDTNRILVTNGKGVGSKSNRHGPNPKGELPGSFAEYIGRLFQGSLSVIDPPTPQKMVEYTKRAFECSPLREDKRPVTRPNEPGHPIPAQVGDASPIQYVIYLIKENRTYDQVLGDMPEGNGDPSICIFPESVTPNHHAIAREFVLLDNFYVEGEVSADGHEWSMAAYATDFAEKTWPLSYRGDGIDKFKYPSEGAFDIEESSGGYIWDRCKEAGVTYRTYGEFVDNGPTPNDPCTARLENLKGHFDPWFRSYDLDYPDVKRTDRFLDELARFEREGDMPRFQIVRLPNDHTFGAQAGKPTPTAMVAENDLAFGRFVEGVSRSKFWPKTAIFVVEDDAQNGSDHVDAHRTIAFVISPYCKRKFVDSSMYSTSSMLRTMELILGLKPMTQFDAAARPMYGSFQAKPDLTPFTHRPATANLKELNALVGPDADLSRLFDFSREDAADDLLLNQVVWRSVRGANSIMPAPVRASFVMTHDEEREEDDEFDKDDDDQDEDDE